MGVYIPLKVRLAKASIPQVVAYIQTYLEENPITGVDKEGVEKIVSDYIELNKSELKGDKGEPFTYDDFTAE